MAGKDTTLYDVSELTSFFKAKLAATNGTKYNILPSSDDARDILHRCFIPDQRRRIEPCQCTCVRPCSENDANVVEIAKGIGYVVQNAQKLRETITARKSRPVSKSSQTQTDCNTIEYGGKNQLEKAQTNRPRGVLKSNSMQPSSVYTRPRVPSSTVTKPTVPRSSCSSLSNSRPPSVKSSTSKSTSSTQSTYQRDFARRLPSKPSNTNGKVAATINKKSSTSSIEVSQKSEGGSMSIAKLEKLLSRVSIDATLYAKPDSTHSTDDKPVTSQKSCNSNCSVHGNNVSEPLKQNDITPEKQVGLAEAIDVLGVSSDLVKVLQSYHRFLEKHCDDSCKNEAESKAASAFLGQLSKANERVWSEAMNEPCASLFADYMPLYTKVSKLRVSGRKSAKTLSNLRDNFEALEKIYRKCSNHDGLSATVKPKRGRASVYAPTAKQKLLQRWAVAGIWNDDSLSSFKGMDDSLCIRYNNLQQLQLFHSNIHQIQIAQFQIRLLEMLANKIVPQLENKNPKDDVFYLLLKVCIALCDPTKLRMPIILRRQVETVQENTTAF